MRVHPGNALAIRLVLVGISSAALKIWFHPLTNNSVYDGRQIQVAETRLVARLQRVFARPLFDLNSLNKYNITVDVNDVRGSEFVVASSTLGLRLP